MKKIFAVVLSISILVMGGCRNLKDDPRATSNKYEFSVSRAKEVVAEYFKNVKANDFEKCKSLLSKKMIEIQKNREDTELYIKNYEVEDVSGIGNLIRFNINVEKAKNDNSFTILEAYIVDVTKEEDNYKISNIDTSSRIEVFKDGEDLRLRDNNFLNTNLLLTLDDIPKYSFKDKDLARLSKIAVPYEKIDYVTINGSGNKIGMTVSGSNKHYIASFEIDLQLLKKLNQIQDGKSSQQGTGGSTDVVINTTREICVGKDITSFDIMEDVNIENLVFSRGGTFLVNQYRNDKGTTIKMYSTETSREIPFSFKEKYDINKYDVTFEQFEKDYIKYNVVERGTNNRTTYKLDLKSFEATEA